MSPKFATLALLALFGCAARRNMIESAAGQYREPTVESLQALSAELAAAPSDRQMPFDPGVKSGVLPNGVRWFIEPNGVPPGRAELRLVVNIGSIAEDPDQLGIAHFIEHMAFNGTRNFSGTELVHWLEAQGAAFGSHINAQTGFDTTTYVLRVPSRDPVVMDTAVRVLRDWADGITFDPIEFEKERGVVLEEWRSTQGASSRARKTFMPLMLHNSRYLEREPIGTENSIRTVTLESARRFYQDWYRPDLISIIAVGDFNPTDMETQIEAAFADLKGPSNPRTRTAWSVPDHSETLIGVVADPEITHSTVAIQVKVDAMEGQDLRHYRDSVLVSNLFFLMMNERLAVIAQSPGAPFLGASISQEQLNADRGLVSLGALVPEGNVEGGLEALLVELERARRHGFTLAELDRAKAIFNRNMQNYYNERRNTDSGTHADELERHVTTGEPVPGIPYEFALANALIPQVGLPEVQQFIDRALPEQSRTILVGVPAKAGLTPPSEAALRAIVAEIKDKPIAPPAEEAAAGPLVKEPPKPGKIIAERKIGELGVTEWQLENGLRVWLKPTGFKRDQVLFSADFSRGHDAIDPKLSVPAETAVELVGRSGLGDHDTVALGRLLAGSEVGIRPWIGDTRHGLTGGSSGSPEDLDRLFQLAYLHLAAPRFSADGLELVRENRKSNLVNRRASPEGRFYETWGTMVGPKDPRRDPWEVETLSRLDAKASEAVWRQLFGITEGGQIVLVGNFQPEQVRPLVETWLASLPKGAMIPAAYPFGPPQGGQRLSQITAGNAPTARVQYRIEGTYDGSRTEAHALRSLGGALDIQLREAVREEKGGTYGVAVDMDLMELDQPRWALTIAFDCDPERVIELEEAMVATLEDARQGKIPADVLDRIRARQTDEWQVGRTSNGWWRDALVLGARKGETPAQILDGLDLITTFDLPKLHATAAKVLGSTDQARLIMLPETSGPSTAPSPKGHPGSAP